MPTGAASRVPATRIRTLVGTDKSDPNDRSNQRIRHYKNERCPGVFPARARQKQSSPKPQEDQFQSPATRKLRSVAIPGKGSRGYTFPCSSALLSLPAHSRKTMIGYGNVANLCGPTGVLEQDTASGRSGEVCKATGKC
jgi:hypothetical protein